MKPKYMLGLLLAGSTAPALAQYGAPPPQPPQIPPPAQQSQSEEAPAQKGPSPSNGARKAIIELQTAVNANDTANIPTKLSAAQAVAKTKDDKYIVGQLALKAALAAKDNGAIAAAIETIATSGYITGTQAGNLYMGLGSTYYSAKQFDQAAAAFERAAALDPANGDAVINLGEARFAQGRKADAVAAFTRAIQAKLAAGQKPSEAVYKRVVGVAYDAQLPAASELARQWVAAYPGPDSWRNSIAIYRNMTKPDVEGTLDLLRLMQATGGLSSPADYSLFATAAADQGNYNEAKAVIDQGLAAKHIEATSPIFREVIAGLKSKQIATEADLASATKSAANGMALLRIGDRYYGMGQYQKAADLYRQAAGKPGVDAGVANLHLGMALARSGDKAGATAAFNAVSGPRSDIAKFWLLYLQTRA
jgi:tetratricopeptide (TPR) repeat protein